MNTLPGESIPSSQPVTTTDPGHHGRQQLHSKVVAWVLGERANLGPSTQQEKELFNKVATELNLYRQLDKEVGDNDTFECPPTICQLGIEFSASVYRRMGQGVSTSGGMIPPQRA